MAAEPREVLEQYAAKHGEKQSTGYGPGVRKVEIKVSTNVKDEESGEKKALRGDFQCPMPFDLNTAVEVFGEKAVHRYFCNALVVDIQATERNKLTPPEGTGRKKARYLEEMGL